MRQRQRRAFVKRTRFNRGDIRWQVRQRQRRAARKRTVFNSGDFRWQFRQRQRSASLKRTRSNRGGGFSQTQEAVSMPFVHRVHHLKVSIWCHATRTRRRGPIGHPLLGAQHITPKAWIFTDVEKATICRADVCQFVASIVCKGDEHEAQDVRSQTDEHSDRMGCIVVELVLAYKSTQGCIVVELVLAYKSTIVTPLK